MGDDVERLELRHCTCRSTLSMPMASVTEAANALATADDPALDNERRRI